MVEQLVKNIALYVAFFAEAAAAVVIVIGSIQAIWVYLRYLISKKCRFDAYNLSRLKFGHALSLGLSFLVGADIIKSAVIHTWESIGQLGLIVVIRIVLNYFLQKDMQEVSNVDVTDKC